MAGAIFEQQGAAFVLGAPGERAMDGRFRENEGVTGFQNGLSDVVGGTFEATDLFRDIAHIEIALVAARHAGKTTGAFGVVSEVMGDDGQAVIHGAISEVVPMRAAASPVKAPEAVAAAHEHAVVVIKPYPGAEQFDEIR